MIDGKKASREIGRLATLKFFPSDSDARVEIYGLVCERLAVTDAQIEWLVRRTLELWNAWEGPRELRAVFCSRFPPADGIESYSALPQFEDGIPSEHEEMFQIAAAAPQRMLSGEVQEPEPISEDPELVKLVTDAVDVTRLRVRIQTPEQLPGENDYQALLRILDERKGVHHVQ